RSAVEAATPGAASVTTSDDTSDRAERVSAWKLPMRPRPISPSLMSVLLFARYGGFCPASVRAAGDALVPVEDGAGDDTTAVGEQEDAGVGDLVDLAELAHRDRGVGLFDPIVPGAVERALGGVLALGPGPADVEAVDPDPVPAVGVGGVAGQAGQTGLGRDVGGEVGRAAEFGDRDDV